MDKQISLRDGIRFHGHLGPYLVLGIMAGEFALKHLRCRRHFGIHVKVWGAQQKPKSCLIDGLQLSTGATYGKGNIEKCGGEKLKISFRARENHKRLSVRLQRNVLKRLSELKGHHDSEHYARVLYKTPVAEIFSIEGT